VTRGLAISVALHVAVFAAAWLGPRPKPFEWDPEKPHLVELVAAAPLPRAAPPKPRPVPPRQLEAPVKEPVQEVPEEKPADTKPEVTPVKPPPKVQPRPPRTFQRIAPKRTDEGPTLEERLQQRLEHVEEQEEAEEASPPDAADTEAPTPSEPTAEVEALDFPFAWYLRQVQTRVRDAWDTPGNRLLAGHPNPVGVTLVIHRDGHVSDARIEVSSGNAGLDASALRAVQRAQPFPPLPEPYEGERLALTIRFRVEGGQP